MNVHDRGAGVAHAAHELVGVDDHQVNVEGLLGFGGDGVDHREAEGYVGDKDAVHNVEVVPVGLRAVEHFNVAIKIAEVSGEK